MIRGGGAVQDIACKITPAPQRHVGNRVFVASQVLRVGEVLVENAIVTLNFFLASLLKRGELVEKRTSDPCEPNVLYVAWRSGHEDRALQWWIDQLRQPRLSNRLIQGIDTFA